MPVSVQEVKTAVATDGTPLVGESGKDFVIAPKGSLTAAQLEELGIAIATLLAKVLNPIP